MLTGKFDEFRVDMQNTLKEDVKQRIDRLDYQVKHNLKEHGLRFEYINGSKGRDSDDDYDSGSEYGKQDPASTREIIRLNHFIRKYKAFNVMKTTIMKERHQREILKEREKRSQNT